jgi:hypothetical protein
MIIILLSSRFDLLFFCQDLPAKEKLNIVALKVKVRDLLAHAGFIGPHRLNLSPSRRIPTPLQRDSKFNGLWQGCRV